MSLIQEVTQHVAIVRATVTDVNERGVVISWLEGEIQCSEILETPGSRAPLLAVGDSVVVWQAAPETPPVVLGRISTLCRREEAPVDTLIIEAKQSLTLKVGDGSITIREDGRILIKGKDLVSHAKRNNRIRGGSVQIN